MSPEVLDRDQIRRDPAPSSDLSKIGDWDSLLTDKDHKPSESRYEPDKLDLIFNRYRAVGGVLTENFVTQAFAEYQKINQSLDDKYQEHLNDGFASPLSEDQYKMRSSSIDFDLPKTEQMESFAGIKKDEMTLDKKIWYASFMKTSRSQLEPKDLPKNFSDPNYFAEMLLITGAIDKHKDFTEQFPQIFCRGLSQKQINEKIKENRKKFMENGGFAGQDERYKS